MHDQEKQPKHEAQQGDETGNTLIFSDDEKRDLHGK